MVHYSHSTLFPVSNFAKLSFLQLDLMLSRQKSHLQPDIGKHKKEHFKNKKSPNHVPSYFQESQRNQQNSLGYEEDSWLIYSNTVTDTTRSSSELYRPTEVISVSSIFSEFSSCLKKNHKILHKIIKFLHKKSQTYLKIKMSLTNIK